MNGPLLQIQLLQETDPMAAKKLHMPSCSCCSVLKLHAQDRRLAASQDFPT